jgi:hypothetical protein
MSLCNPRINIISVRGIISCFILFVPVFTSHIDHNYQINTYCLAAIVFGIGIIFKVFRNPLCLIRITIFGILITSLVVYIIAYQLIFEQYFDFQITSRVLAGTIIFLFAKLTKGNIKSVFDVIILYGLIEVIIVLIEIIGLYSFSPDSIHLINGSFGNPNVVAIFLGLLIPISIYRYNTALHARNIYIFFTLLFISAIVLTKCRSAIIFSAFNNSTLHA